MAMFRALGKYKLFGRYFCCNCGHWFRHGYFESEKNDPELMEIYDDICPYCGADANEWWLCCGVYWDKIKRRVQRKK